jgi:hypothetical protein
MATGWTRIGRTLALGCALLAAGLAAAPAHAADPTPKIVGGGSVSIDDHPWQVSLDIVEGDEVFGCGGSIRDAQHVVTAAHCVIDDSGDYPVILPPYDFTVGYGSANLDTQSHVGVAAVTVDRRYERDLASAAYDDAVLTLTSPIAFGSPGHAPQAVQYATEQELEDRFGDGGFVTGWGTLSEGGDPPADNNLRGAAVPLQGDPSCVDEYGAAYVPALMICAGGTGTDTCQGDSGGPLTIDTDPTSGVDRKLVGITSGGNGCGRAGVPGYYTWVQSPAIQQVISDPSPVAAPAGPPAANPTLTGVLRVGRRVTCNPPALADASPSQYLWYQHRQASGFAALGTARTITLPAAAEGARVQCDVRYEAAGGFVYKEPPVSAFAGPVGPAAFLRDTRVGLALAPRRIPASGPLRVAVSNGNDFRVTGSLSGRSAAALHTKRGSRRISIPARAFSAAAHGRPVVKLQLPAAIQDALEKHGRVRLDLRAVVRDPAGHARTVTATVTARKR